MLRIPRSRDESGTPAIAVLTERVTLAPPDDDEPPGIELTGDLGAMLGAVGLAPAGGQPSTAAGIPGTFTSSAKAAPGGRSPLALTCPRPPHSLGP